MIRKGAPTVNPGGDGPGSEDRVQRRDGLRSGHQIEPDAGNGRDDPGKKHEEDEDQEYPAHARALYHIYVSLGQEQEQDLGTVERRDGNEVQHGQADIKESDQAEKPEEAPGRTGGPPPPRRAPDP